MDDVQLELPQICPSCTAAVGVRCPVAAKFNPESEIIWPPDEAAFDSVLLTTGPSKLRSLRLVPTRDDPTAMTRAADADFGTPVLQATVVTDVRADVLHAPSESPQISPWACGPGRPDAPILILSRNNRSIRPLRDVGMTEKRDVAVLQQTLADATAISNAPNDHHTAPAKAKIPNNLRDGNQGAWRASATSRGQRAARRLVQLKLEVCGYRRGKSPRRAQRPSPRRDLGSGRSSS